MTNTNIKVGPQTSIFLFDIFTDIGDERSLLEHYHSADSGVPLLLFGS